MRLLNYCFLIGGILIASCVGNSSNKSQNDKKINAIANGLTKDYYKKVKQEITATNEAIKKGVMKGANVKRIPDFQSVK